MIIHSPIISGSLTFADGATVTYPDGGSYSGSFSGSIQISEVQSHLIPDSSASYDLGSEAFPFRDLYVSSNTIKLGGIGIGAGIGGLNIKNTSDDSPAEIAAKSITIGGLLGGVGSKKFKLNDNNKIEVRDENDDIDSIEVKEIILKDTSGNGKNTVVKNDGGRFTTSEVDNAGTVTAVDSEGSLSGSFTGSVLDLTATGDAIFNDAVTVSGVSSLDGGVNVAENFIVDASGNISTTGTMLLPEGSLTIGSTTITTNGTELNLLSGSQAGVVVDTKAVVYGNAGEVNATKLQVGGVDITSTPAELNILDGVTATTAEINKLDGVTSSTAELNILDGVTATAAELNILDGVTATAAELNALDGITVDATKLNYLTDMTGNVKNYIDTEVAGVVDSAPAALDTLNELAAALGDDANFATSTSTALGNRLRLDVDNQSLSGTQITNALTNLGITSTNTELNLLDGVSGLVKADFTKLAAVDASAAELNILDGATLTTAELNYVDGVTSNIQTQLDTLAGTDIGITLTGAVTGTGTITNLGDVSIATTATPDPTLTIDGDASGTATFTNLGDATLTLTITDDSHNHTIANVDGLQTALDGKLATTHDFSITLTGDVTGTGTVTDMGDVSFSTTIADDSHNHVISNVDGLQTALDAKQANLSAGTGVSISSNTVSIGQSVATNASVTFATVSATGDIVAYASSDERLKDNIEVISNPIEKVQQLKGVTWDWNDNADELQKSLPNVGVIAQDVEKVLPQLVKDRDNGFKGVDYDKLVGLLIEAVKDQQTQIDELKSKLS